MRYWLGAVLLITGVASVSLPAQQAPARRQLDIAFDEQGNVTLAAQGVSVREILAEWARQGGSQFVNLDKLTGPPLAMPMRFEKQPELEVMQSLLASVAGVIIGPRLADAPGRSRLGTVVILASSSPSASTTSFTPASSTRQVAPPPVTPGSPTDELPPVRPPGASQDPASTPGPAPNANRPTGFQPVNIVPITPVGGRGGGGTTGRGGGGGGLRP